MIEELLTDARITFSPTRGGKVQKWELLALWEQCGGILEEHQNSIDAVATPEELSIEAGENLLAGMAVYPNVSGKLVKAQANSVLNATGVVIVKRDTLTGFAGDIVQDALQLADWTPIVGTQFLTPKTIYFLSPTDPGKLTATPPTTSGQVLLWLGTALSTEVLFLVRSSFILL